MKKIFTALFLVMMSFGTLALQSCSYVEAGNVGIKVNLLGDDKGVSQEVLSPGRYWIGWNERLYTFPTFMQNYVWTKDAVPGSETDEALRFQTVEGMLVIADVGISYAIVPDKVPLIFQKYRKGVDEITDIYLRNMVRDALVAEASTMKIDDAYGRGKEQLLADVEKRVRDQVEPIGIKIDRIYWIGSFELPPEVVKVLNAKINAGQLTQQREQEIQQTKMEAQKNIEEARGKAESVKLDTEARVNRITAEAKAQAEANRELAKSITPELTAYIQATKWNGELPKITGGATPFVNTDSLLSSGTK